MAVTSPRPERITPSLTVQAPLGGRVHGPGLVIVSLPGTAMGVDPQQAFAQEGYTVAHLRLSPAYGDIRVRDELREATESLDFYERCSNKSQYGIIVYNPAAYPSLIDAINGNGEIISAVFFGEPPKPCSKPHKLLISDEDMKSSASNPGQALEFLKSH